MEGDSRADGQMQGQIDRQLDGWLDRYAQTDGKSFIEIGTQLKEKKQRTKVGVQ